MNLRIRIRAHERGFYFRNREFVRVLRPGVHWLLDPLGRNRVDRVSVRDPWIQHAELDVIVRSGGLAGEALVLDVKDEQRALVWVDGRANRILGPGLYAVWTVFKEVRAEIVELREPGFEHPELSALIGVRGAELQLQVVRVEAGHGGLLFVDGVLRGTLGPGVHAFWRDGRKVAAQDVDLRERMIDVGGQEIMTADKVTLRLNAVVAFRVVDPGRAATSVAASDQSLYRETQLALRGVLGTMELEALLAEKDAVGTRVEAIVRERAGPFGIEVTQVGIRDIILPGDMKELLNRVTEARKAAEASLVTRREEIAAARMQANTAKILESSPVLMRLRELETLEKIADKTNLTVVLGEQGLTDRVVKLL